ncbi:MAG: hypothetical protein DYH02_04880 [Candidatus Omnitrophica bacterium COP1]|nr:hypothetical protein [Candidatus Omnitrophica bacterium COP1]
MIEATRSPGYVESSEKGTAVKKPNIHNNSNYAPHRGDERRLLLDKNKLSCLFWTGKVPTAAIRARKRDKRFEWGIVLFQEDRLLIIMQLI